MTLYLDLALVALTTAAFWSAPMLGRPNLPFGVRVPGARIADPAILRVRRQYSRGVLAIGLASCAILAVAELGFDRLLAAEIALPVVAVAFCLLGYHAHRSVAAAKRAGDWYAGLRQGTTTDTSLRTDPVRPPWLLLIPAVAIAVITAAIGVLRYGELPSTLPTPNGLTVDAGARTPTTVSFAFSTVTAQILAIVVIVLLVIALPRVRPELDAEHPVTSATNYRAYLGSLLKILLSSAGCVNASLLVASLQVWEILEPTVLVTVVSYLPLLAASIAWLVFAFRTGEAGSRLPATEGEQSTRVQYDDDRHWHLAGMIYLNRNDPAILIHRRVGTYLTLNLGNPISWLILLTITAIAVLSGTGIIELPQRGS